MVTIGGCIGMATDLPGSETSMFWRIGASEKFIFNLDLD